MLVMVGDVHGEFYEYNQLLNRQPQHATIIQLGDFGFWRRAQQSDGTPPFLMADSYIIDGNHEEFPMLAGKNTVTEIWPKAHYVPRGTILTLAGKRIGFLGGGDSIDRDMRIRGMNWWPEEAIKAEDVDRLLHNAKQVGGVDILCTHVPPEEAKRALFHYAASISERLVQLVWEELQRPPLYCGHMHPDTVVQYQNVTVIPILETVIVR